MSMQHPVIDIHCDLLFYLGLDERRTPYDLPARCAIPQLHQGGVKLQTMAIFTETEPASVEKGMHQYAIYQKLPQQYPKDFQHVVGDWKFPPNLISTLFAFENASGFCGEGELLQKGFDRLATILKTSKPLYISLTWNTENRFGGGALSPIGLKADGKQLLEEIDNQHIALDLSHASDALAYESIDYIEGKGLKIPVIASHSNARAVVSVPRNLPDDIAKEIFKRGGIIGFNLFRPFVGQSTEQLLKHFAHWLELGGENNIAFGADFFHDPDLPTAYQHGMDVFFQEYGDASSYPSLLTFLQKELKTSPSFVQKVSHQNVIAFAKRQIF